MLCSQTDSEEHDKVEPETTTTTTGRSKSEQHTSRVYEFERKPGYRNRDPEPIYGSTEKSPDLERMFLPYPDEFVEYIYVQHRCK